MRKTTEQFIKEAKKVYKDTYNYSLVKYINNKTKVKIICPEHGVFTKEPKSFLKGFDCPKCLKNGASNTKIFVGKAKKVHGNKYDYSLVDYINFRTKVKIICSQHGVFQQEPRNHIQGQGCKQCANNTQRDKLEQFIEKARKVHNNNYNYSKVNYQQSHEKIGIICKKHGVFQQEPNSHLNGAGCPKCSKTGLPSKKEQVLNSFLSETFKVETSNREILNGKELDIYIPSKNIAIEFNGLYWHSDKYKDRNYHLNKTKECKKKGIQLIHIFEDEWDNKQEIVKSRLLNILGKTPGKIYARNCEIKLVNTKDKTKFLNENHIQGTVGSKINLGLYYNNELVSLMTFGKLRKNLGLIHKYNNYELLRFCNKLNITIVGGASKLLKYFQKNYEYNEIISYCDLRWSQGNLYKQLNFEEIYKTNPNYFYLNSSYTKRENRFKYRKSELIKWNWGTKDQTEKEIMQSKEFHRIYDCGTIKFKMTKTS